MKIVRFSQNGHAPRLGCSVHQDETMELAASCVACLTVHGVVRASAMADAFLPQSTRGFLEGGVATQERLAQMLEGLTDRTFEPVMVPAAEVRFHAPTTSRAHSFALASTPVSVGMWSIIIRRGLFESVATPSV